MKVFVQFETAEERKIVAVFGNPQPDIDTYPNQGEVQNDDPRLALYYDQFPELPWASPPAT